MSSEFIANLSSLHSIFSYIKHQTRQNALYALDYAPAFPKGSLRLGWLIGAGLLSSPY